MKILLAYDGSDSSQLALQKVAEFAKKDRDEVVVVSVMPPVLTYTFPMWSPVGEPLIDWQGATTPQQVEQAAEKRESSDKTAQEILTEAHSKQRSAFQKRLDEVVQEFTTLGLKSRSEIRDGVARMELCEFAEAEKADLIVIGSRGHGAVKRLLLGSVSTYVVTHAPCSVLVVRPTK